MSKNKVTTYVLLVGVIAVWGIIVYKVVNGLGKGNDESFVAKEASLDLKAIAFEKKDSVIISSALRDPFLDKRMATKSKVFDDAEKKHKPVSSKIHNTIKSTIPKGIEFKGTVKGDKGVMALVVWQNHNLMLSVGDEFKGLKIIKIRSKMVEVKLNNKQYILDLSR